MIYILIKCSIDGQPIVETTPCLWQKKHIIWDALLQDALLLITCILQPLVIFNLAALVFVRVAVYSKLFRFQNDSCSDEHFSNRCISYYHVINKNKAVWSSWYKQGLPTQTQASCMDQWKELSIGIQCNPGYLIYFLSCHKSNF